MTSTLKWYGNKVIAKVEDRTEGVLDRGSILIVNKSKALMREPKTGRHYPGKVTKSSAEDEAPAVQTGKLRSSIHWLKPKTLLRLIGTNLAYGFFLEKGTIRIKARPFLRPAFKAVKKKIAKMLKRIV